MERPPLSSRQIYLNSKDGIEEINKITEPDYSLSFLADGVIIK